MAIVGKINQIDVNDSQFAIDLSYLNLNDFLLNPNAYTSKQSARGYVPTYFRTNGRAITYKLALDNDYIWVSEQFIGSSWSTANADWLDLGPVKVTQNTITGHTDINIGNDDYPVASIDDFNKKLDKVLGSNIVNPDTLTSGKYITASGEIGNGGEQFYVSEPILIDGKDITIYAVCPNVNSIRPWVAYDINGNLTRVGAVPTTTTALYEYDAENYPNDYYIRFGFQAEGADAEQKKRANYGSTLAPYTPYTDFKPLDDIEKEVEDIENNVASITNRFAPLSLTKIDKQQGTNIINPLKSLKNKYIRRDGSLSSGGDGFYVTEEILIDGKDIIIGGGITVNVDAIRPWVAYDINGNITRVGGVPTTTTVQYTFDATNYPNDFCIRFGYYEDAYANYGTVLATKQPYIEYMPLIDLEKKIYKDLYEKLDKEVGINIVDPSKVTDGKYITSSGDIGSGASGFYVSDLIPIDGKNISMYAVCPNVNAIRPWVAYDISGNITRVGGVPTTTTALYEYDGVNYPNDKYLRIGFQPQSDELSYMRANYGSTLAPYKPFTDYKPLEDLEVRVEALEQGGGGTQNFVLSFVPNCIYGVYNSVVSSRQTIARLYMSHLLNSLDYKNLGFFFDNSIRNLPIIPTVVSTKSETSKSITITPKTKYAPKTFSTKLRISNNATSKDVTPKVLVIGDSVTAGYGSNSNKKDANLPNTYWGYAKMLFEMDKIDGGDNASEYNALFIGRNLEQGDFTINYSGVQRTVRARYEAAGGASLPQLFESTWGGYGASNPFYDSANQTFSILSYLEKYRTMDNLGVRLPSNSANPAGETVVGSDGVSYTIGTEIDTQAKLANYDICEPTHIVINLNHNTSLAEYEANISQVISILQNEISDISIILMVIDETGGYFPCDYPNYNPEDIVFGGLHSKNGTIYNYIKNSIEDESNSVYLLGAQFIQPTAESYPTLEVDYSENVGRSDIIHKFNIANSTILGRTYHPNNYAHDAWGYALYSMLKWLIS